jgi:hypothetical protein
VPVNPIAMAPLVVLSPLIHEDVSTEVQDHINRVDVEEYDEDDGSTPNTPPFRKRILTTDNTPPFRERMLTIFLPIIDVDVTRKVEDQTDVKTMGDDDVDDGSTPNARHPSNLDELTSTLSLRRISHHFGPTRRVPLMTSLTPLTKDLSTSAGRSTT